MHPLLKARRLSGRTCLLAGHFSFDTLSLELLLPYVSSSDLFAIIFCSLPTTGLMSACSGGSIYVTDGEVFVQL